MLAVAERYKTTETNFSDYFMRKYEIINPLKMLKSLQTRGFIDVGSPIDMLPSLKVAELKDINEENISIYYDEVTLVKDFWEKKEKWLCFLFNHRDLSTITDSINRLQAYTKNNDYDNSVCESFFANMKREELYRRNYKTETEFFNGVHNYIAFYNSERPHSLLRYQTPDKYEEMYYFYNPNRTCMVQKEQ